MTKSSEKEFLDKLMKRIAQIRRDKSITQEQLAADTGLDRVAIANIETGKRRPTVTTIYRLAKGLGVKIEDLFTGL
jgi:transcriptional regulator with XRE-family HTH domain